MKNKDVRVNSVYRLTDKYNKWYSDHADEIYAIGGILHFKDVQLRDTIHDTMVGYGLKRFSWPSELDIYVLVEQEMNENGCFRVYYFNELGHEWGYIQAKDLETL